MFKTPTVEDIDIVTKTIVNTKYFPSNGTAIEVGGIISASSKKKTVSESNILIHSATNAWDDKIDSIE